LKLKEKKMYRYILSVGSNKKDRLNFLKQSLNDLSLLGEIVLKSSIFESEPVGNIDQGLFLNAIITFHTNLNPFDLLIEIKRIEKELGREKNVRWGPREIDIDIVEYDRQVIKTKALIIPHIEMENRKFVLIPLAEILPEFKNRKSTIISQIISRCPDITHIKLHKTHW